MLWLLSSLPFLLPGVHIDSALTGILVAAVLAVLNSILKPLLVILTIPITLLTFGLFLLVINAGMILLASKLVSGFHVNGFLDCSVFQYNLIIDNIDIQFNE